MKNLFFILFVSFSCYAQESRNNYIISNNYASEAEFWFHEQQYDSAVYYYEKAFEFASEPHPSQRYNLAKALWKLKKYEPSIEMLQQCRIAKIDTAWFSGLPSARYAEITDEIDRQITRNDSIKNCSIYNAFIDSVKTVDQFYLKQFNSRMDSLTYIKPFPVQFRDSIEPIWWESVAYHNKTNGQALIEFTQKYGFPAGVNTCWDQTAITVLLHMSPEWFIENYVLLYNEVVKGNLEPWMLAQGIDRRFTVEIGEDKINPYNRYWKESTIHPFLMFHNCVSLGVSPYYDFNWAGTPKKTIHFDYYKEHKTYYSTTFQYTHFGK